MFDQYSEHQRYDDARAYAQAQGMSAQQVQAAINTFEHIQETGCACPSCLNRDTSTAGATNPDAAAVDGDLTDYINWGEQAVNSGQFNADGDMIIEYYFVPGGGTFQGIFPRLNWTDYEKQQVEVAFSTYEAILDVEFVETDVQADAEFKLNKINSFGLFLGVMNPPQEANAGAAGFAGTNSTAGWDRGDANGDPTNGGLEQGGFGFVTLIHEFGHGLGLAHPHDNGGGSGILPGVNGDPQTDTGAFDLNQGVYTIMSYVDGWATNPAGALGRDVTVEYGYQGTPMAIDIAHLQSLYGANMDYATGDDVYLLPDVNERGTFYSCIWDAGGTDEMRYDGDRAAVIDLRAASLQLEEGGGGWISFALGTYGGFTIANGVVIENATGGGGDDALVGNAADNVLTGRGGADTFIFTADGGGFDTIADFENGSDLVDVSDLGPIARSDLSFSFNGGAVITYEDQSIFFDGVGFGQLSVADFVLV